jgi:hypothetical protein
VSGGPARVVAAARVVAPARLVAPARVVARARVVAAARVVARARVVAARGRSRAGASSIFLAAVLAGCGGGDRPSAPAEPPGTPAERVGGARTEPSDTERLRALLDARAAALEAGDGDAYAATSALVRRRRDREHARRAGRVRLRDVEYELADADIDGARASLRVTASYELEGVRSVFRSTRRMTARRAGGEWTIRAVEGRRGLPPWEVATFAERRRRHFVVLAAPGVPVDQLLPHLEDGYARMRELLSRGSLRRRYVVVVAGDAIQARALTTSIRGVETLTAISDAAIREEGRQREVTHVASLRLLVVWPPFAALEAGGRVRVVTHELTHAALAGSTSGRTPAWLVEGVALYVSGDRRPAPPGADLADLAPPLAIARLAGDAQADAYAASSAAAYAIVERFGRPSLLDLYDAFNDPALRGRPGAALVNRAVRRELGISTSEILPGS